MYHQGNTNMLNSQQQLQAIVDMSSSAQRTSSESDMGRNIIDSESTGNETMEPPASGDDQDPNQRPKRGRYHRHTQHQIDEMELLFKDYPHPDEKQRKELGLALGLDPMQIKFWFQNKRTQVKSQHERHENNLLRAENEKLREDNAKYKEALSAAACSNCGGPSLPNAEMSVEEQRLRIENARLRQEVDKMSALSAKYGLQPANSSQNNMDWLPVELGVGNTLAAQPLTVGGIHGGSDEPLSALPIPILSDSDKAMIPELAVAAMEELTRLALSGEPMWIPGNFGMEILNQDEYFRNYPKGIVSNAMGSRPETSRQSAVIIMNHVKFVEIIMDVNKWSKMFCSIVATATTSEVLSTGVAGNYNGALQVMSAEFQVPSPYVPTRTDHFVRYCKQLSEESWAIVDFSMDHLQLTPNATIRSKRRPSGCIIQELPNGYSKVIWIEHAEVDNSEVHNLYKILVNSALGFGAKRWVATLDRQCERLASSMATNVPAGELCGVITSHEGRTSILKLSERMILSFCTGVGAAAIHPWLPITSCDGVRVMAKKCVDDPGKPSGIVLSASTSLWFSIPAKRMFDFLRDETTRNQWDILANGGIVHELAYIANGRDSGNSVSLLRVNGSNSAQSNMIIVQETRTDVTGSYVVYAPLDLAAFNTVLSGSDPDYAALLPSGFAILPDGPGLRNGGPINEVGSGGCLLTAAFQILVDSGPSAKLSLSSVKTVETLIKCTVDKIKNAIARHTAP